MANTKLEKLMILCDTDSFKLVCYDFSKVIEFNYGLTYNYKTLILQF